MPRKRKPQPTPQSSPPDVPAPAPAVPTITVDELADKIKGWHAPATGGAAQGAAQGVAKVHPPAPHPFYFRVIPERYDFLPPEWVILDEFVARAAQRQADGWEVMTCDFERQHMKPFGRDAGPYPGFWVVWRRPIGEEQG